MAGPTQRGSRGHGRSSRPGTSDRRAAASVAESGSTLTTRPRGTRNRQAPVSDQLVTRSTYRLLLMKGMAPEEAANLTAFMCGIPVAEVHWSLRQVNQLLFLRQLARTGRFGSEDGDTPRPH